MNGMIKPQGYNVGDTAYMWRNKRIGGGTLKTGDTVIITAHRRTTYGVHVYSAKFINEAGKMVYTHEAFAEEEFFTKEQAKKRFGKEVIK